MMEGLMVRGLYVRPDEQPIVKELGTTEAQMEDLVDGKIASMGIDDGVCLIYNAFSDMLHMPHNRTVYNQKVYGPFVVLSFDQYGNLTSLNEENLNYYQNMFSL